MKNNKLISNSVKILEWSITHMIREKMGSVYYNWTSSPVKALRGGQAEFLAQITKNGEKASKSYNGTVSIYGDGRLNINLVKTESADDMVITENIHLY